MSYGNIIRCTSALFFTAQSVSYIDEEPPSSFVDFVIVLGQLILLWTIHCQAELPSSNVSTNEVVSSLPFI